MEDNQGELFDMNEDQLFDIHYGGATAGDWKARTPQPDNPSLPKYRYSEDDTLQEFKEYLNATYDQHYANDDLQTFDVWAALGIAPESCQSNVLKYAMRYGKKDGYNKKDLFKIIHYTILWIHYVETKSQETNNDETHR